MSMAFVQRVIECPDEHPDCEVIECADAEGNVAWHSHAHNSTHAECRANPEVELINGDSSTAMCGKCVATFTANLPGA